MARRRIASLLALVIGLVTVIVIEGGTVLLGWR
jgi:hypothetical protein